MISYILDTCPSRMAKTGNLRLARPVDSSTLPAGYPQPRNTGSFGKNGAVNIPIIELKKYWNHLWHTNLRAEFLIWAWVNTYYYHIWGNNHPAIPWFFKDTIRVPWGTSSVEQLRQAPGMVVWNQNIGFESTKRDMTKKNVDLPTYHASWFFL